MNQKEKQWKIQKMNTCFCHRYLVVSGSVTVERANEPLRKDIESGSVDDGDELELDPDTPTDDEDDNDDGNSSWYFRLFDIGIRVARILRSVLGILFVLITESKTIVSRFMLFRSFNGRWYASLIMCSETLVLTSTLKQINTCTLSRIIIYMH